MDGRRPWPDSQIGTELAYTMEFYKARRPAVFLSYERDSFRGVEDEEFRVTFDHQIRYRQEELTLDSDTWGTPILPPGLVRFRSAPGTAREISAIFVAMGTGLITGMGYLAYAALFALILGAATMAYTAFSLRPHSGGPVCRTLHITVPEDLDYIGVFEPVLDEYTRQYSLTQVKTTNMGSLFKLTYDVTMKDAALEKKFIDQLRLRNSSTDTETAFSGNITATTVSAIDTSGVFSDRDLAGTYDESEAIPITLNGDSASCDSSSVVIDGSAITVTAEAVYLISGTLNDGQIIVNAGDTEKVQLVLSGADITSTASAAIYARSADKVFVTLAKDTENTLTSGGEYIAIDDNNIDAVIFAKTDLTLNGSGSLTINAQAGHGVVSKDDLVITGGSYAITAASHALSGKDSVAIADGTFAITSSMDGIHSEISGDASLGWLYIQSGTFTIRSQGDAISAQGALQIDGGTFNLYTGEGSALRRYGATARSIIPRRSCLFLGLSLPVFAQSVIPVLISSCPYEE